MIPSRFSLPLFTGIAFVAAIGTTTLPSHADQTTFVSQANYYRRVSNDFQKRLGGLSSFENSPGGLAAWAKDAAQLASAVDANAKSLTRSISTEASAEYPGANQACQHAEATLFGPYRSAIGDFGFAFLSDDYGFRLADLHDAVKRLDVKEDKLLNKIADATLNGKTPDKATTDLLRETKAALAKLGPLYQQMYSERGYLRNVKDLAAGNVYGPVCGGKEATPTPTLKPTTKPTPAGKSTPAATPTLSPKPNAITTPKVSGSAGPSPTANTKCPPYVPAGWVCNYPKPCPTGYTRIFHIDGFYCRPDRTR